MQKHEIRPIDSELMDFFEQSLSEVIGEESAKSFIVNEHLSRERFDPQEINSALTRVFGVHFCPEGVNLLKEQVLNRFSSSLKIGSDNSIEQAYTAPNENDFVSAVEQMSIRYRFLKAPPKVVSSGAFAALVSSICCLSPLVLALLGFASFSAAASLAMSLTNVFRPLELGGGFGLIAGVAYLQLRKEKQCNIRGVRRNLGYVLVPLASMLLVYAFVNYLLGVYFLGSFNLRDLLP